MGNKQYCGWKDKRHALHTDFPTFPLFPLFLLLLIWLFSHVCARNAISLLQAATLASAAVLLASFC